MVMAGSNGGGGNTGGRGRGRNTARGRARSRDPNPLLVDPNVSAEIGGNFVNPADPNVLPLQNPAVLGGSEVAAPIREGAPRNQGRRRARHDHPPPAQQRRTRTRREPAQNPQPPQPQVPIEHQIPGMGEIPAQLRDPPRRLYRLCRKMLTKSDLKGNLNITGNNRPFLRHMANQAGMVLGSDGLGVDVQVRNGAAPPLDAFFFLTNPGGDRLTLAWRVLFSRMGCRLVAEQYIDMWFEMAPSTMNIYIQGRLSKLNNM